MSRTIEEAKQMNLEKDSNQHGRDEVLLTVNNREVRIHRGHQSVTEIKAAGGVPLADDLDQVVDGRLVQLPDNGAVTIKGGEVFISHPKDSAAS